MSFALHLAALFAYAIISSSFADHDIPIEIKLWDTGRTPLAHMVDVTNELGLKVLAEHNFLNDNNIAFSPYGLMGILLALYEGVDGESSYQMQKAMQLPWNRSVMRIGFRDIHRTLKTYFVPEEGFLAGLALNNENVTFNESYKKVLHFYGFDLESDQLPNLTPQNPNSIKETNIPTSGTFLTTSGILSTSVGGTTENVATQVETSTLPVKEEITNKPRTELMNVITLRTSTTKINPSVTVSTSTMGQNSFDDTGAVVSVMSAVTMEDMQTTIETPTTTSVLGTSVNIIVNGDSETTVTEISSSITQTMDSIINNDMDSVSLKDITTTEATAPPLSSTAEIQLSEQVTTIPTMESITTSNDSANFNVNISSLETLERRKKSIDDFIFTSAPYMDDYLMYRSYGFDGDLFHSDDNKTFLVNGVRNVQVSYIRYEAVLEHAYLPHLEAAALRLPLDSERYYLLVLLPRRGVDLSRLVTRLAVESDLRDVHAALRPRNVLALVPSFTVRGHIILTTDLQKLGIRDAFEPRQSDFTPMTPQPGVYVRSIEQAVSVAIRKYRHEQYKANRYVTSRQRVHFKATFPFLYFVMDSSIHVALMAGKMVDPLNTRIL